MRAFESKPNFKRVQSAEAGMDAQADNDRKRRTHIQVLQQVDLGLRNTCTVSLSDTHAPKYARTMICPISLFGILLS